METSQQIDKLLAEQSAEWSERLRHGDEHDRAEFARWSLKSPQHMRHFLMMVALEKELGQLDPQRQMECSPAANPQDRNVVMLADREVATPIRQRRFSPRHWIVAACAAGIALLAVVHVASPPPARQEYSTSQGEQRAVELADGSVMHLNTQSRVQVHFSSGGRELHLFAGEALFKVAKDPMRPFRVHAANVVIQAVGTQFNVYAQQGGTKVSVLEGRVRISSDNIPSGISTQAPANLDAGEEATIDNEGRIATAKPADVASVAVWRQRRLVFNRDPLSEVIKEFNRYNRAPQFRLMDGSIALRPYSGAFDADDPESLVELLMVDRDLRIENDGQQILIYRRPGVE